jgi:Zn-dependent protease
MNGEPGDPSEKHESPAESARPVPDDGVVLEWLGEPAAAPDSPGAPAPLFFEAQLVSPPPRLRRRRLLPLALFLLTCLSTFFAGACRWIPTDYFLSADFMPLRRVLISHWDEGLIYMASVLAILLTHEMGHFLATVRHGIPASYPYFLPLPISPVGTLGAVIGMDGLRANRRQMFDIGIAGPLAGLVVTLPILWLGVQQLDFAESSYGRFQLDVPLAMRWMLDAIRPPGYVSGQVIWHGQLNPFFMAGWVGLFITALNMMPVSQLDGGHVTYTLLRHKAHWIARAFILVAVGWVFYSGTFGFGVMIVLIMLVGTDHPPTSDDAMPLGVGRTILGWLSLAIPIVCFAPRVLMPS